MDYADREFIVNAMLDRASRGYKIICYPSRYEFRKKVMLFLELDFGKKCMKCGSVENIEIDHIKPKSTHPELELDMNNIQLLCRSCNASKGNRNENKYKIKRDDRHYIF